MAKVYFYLQCPLWFEFYVLVSHSKHILITGEKKMNKSEFTGRKQEQLKVSISTSSIAIVGAVPTITANASKGLAKAREATEPTTRFTVLA